MAPADAAGAAGVGSERLMRRHRSDVIGSNGIWDYYCK